MKVYDGVGLIADKSGAMVVPVKIDGLEATPFSRLSRSQVHRRWFPKVTITVLPPVKLAVADELKGRWRRQAAGAALYEIMSDLVFRTTDTDRTVFQAVVDAAEVHGWKRIAVEDPVTGSLTYKRMLLGANILGKKLMPLAAEGKALGVMLPNANGAVVTILGVMSAGRVPAMINFTAGAASILAACKAAEVTTIVTSRAFIEKAKLGAVAEQLAQAAKVIYLEDVRATVSTGDKLRGLLAYKKPIVARKPDDPAVILFTSGSEGTPKGVVLSHRNQLANCAQAAARIDFGRQDKLFNVLPVFHSFGLTAGTILPLVSGVPIYLYPSPLHYRTVPELIYGVNATIVFGTDTFLAGYARAAHPYDFRSLRYILAGAEPVREVDAPHLHGEIRPAHSRRLRRDRNRAGARAQHADVQQVRHGRPADAGHHAAARTGAGRRRGRAALREGAERDARLPQGRQSRRARADQRRLARHRRHRDHRRAGLRRDQGARQALRQDRRRDDLACGGGVARRAALAGCAVRGRDRARSAQGRAAGAGHAEEGRDAQRIPAVREDRRARAT